MSYLEQSIIANILQWYNQYQRIFPQQAILLKVLQLDQQVNSITQKMDSFHQLINNLISCLPLFAILLAFKHFHSLYTKNNQEDTNCNQLLFPYAQRHKTLIIDQKTVDDETQASLYEFNPMESHTQHYASGYLCESDGCAYIKKEEMSHYQMLKIGYLNKKNDKKTINFNKINQGVVTNSKVPRRRKMKKIYKFFSPTKNILSVLKIISE